VASQAYGRDLSLYEESFLLKMLDKRLAATAMPSAAYAELLVHDSAEAETLFRSLNITYSEFFRNPLTFVLLEQFILPGLVEDKARSGQAEIRIWSAGCAAGQEAYSIAILLDELPAAQENAIHFRIFATDIAPAELATAQRGVYDSAAVQNVRLKHIDKFFTRKDDIYIILPRLKERIAFSVYDLLDERSMCPPASIYGDLDLVICSNVLFYYKPKIQQLVLNKIRRCLSSRGYLVTGEAERAIVERTDGFYAAAPPAAIFQRAKRGGEL
jgi:chemotaxis protein methyltransferase CheR